MKKIALLTFLLLIVFFVSRSFMEGVPQKKMTPVIVTKESATAVLPTSTLTPTPTPQMTIKKENKKVASATEASKTMEDPDSFIPMTEDGGILIGHAIVYPNEKVIVGHGDVIIADMKELEKIKDSGDPLILPPAKFWANGRIPYAISGELKDTPHEQAIQDAIIEYKKHTPVEFVPRRPEDLDYVLFEKGSENCLSNLGKVGGEQKILLSEGCDKGKIMHEMMHTLGFLHEQNREDRDEYLRVLWHNIDENFHLQFKKIKVKDKRILDTGFDFNSIMLYPPEAFSNAPGDYAMVTAEGTPYSTNRHSLSSNDIKRIKIIYSE